MDFKIELQKVKQDIDREIAVVFNTEIAKLKKADPIIAEMMAHAKKITLSGGKRVRPALMVWAYQGAGGTNYAEIVKASVSIELIHSFLLIHDDIIDRDAVRHGVPTIHTRYATWAENLGVDGDAAHFGMSMGVIGGDFLYAIANHTLFAAQFDVEHIRAALLKMQDIVLRTVVGEAQDVRMEYQKTAADKDILSMYENKTARYTMEGPTHLGALLAGSGEELCAQFTQWALPLGIGFQLQDDVIGIFGDDHKVGKPLGSDVVSGKKTLLMNHALKHADKTQKMFLRVCREKTELTTEELAQVRTIMEDTGARTAIEKLIEEHLQSAEDAVQYVKIAAREQELLQGMIAYLRNRTY